MRVAVYLDFRFQRAPDGSIWTETVFERGFWRRYLDVFDCVRVVARAHPVTSIGSGWKRVDGERVSFHAVPYYLGPWQYLRRRRNILAAAKAGVTPAEAVILRAPGQVANCVADSLLRARHPYAVEVLGDPSGVFRSGSVRHPLRWFFRWWFTGQMQRQCRHASAAAYMAAHMEKLYPTAGVAIAVSDVDLPEEAFVSPPGAVRRIAAPGERPFTLITIASLAQMYKGIDVLLEALQKCPGVCLRVVGDGRHRSELEAGARTLGIAERVSFLGQLPAGDGVRRELDGADLFVLPSRTEGLPRALIEAMARGLPCLGSAVGGIPELLAPEDLVPVGDSAALAARIMEVRNDRARLARMALRNVEHARQYHETVLRPRRRAFYERVREMTERWVKGRTGLCVSCTS
jgi:glycosyltransferase involved in cell wall biosynthesis